jgi:hypothetical protein
MRLSFSGDFRIVYAAVPPSAAAFYFPAFVICLRLRIAS